MHWSAPGPAKERQRLWQNCARNSGLSRRIKASIQQKLRDIAIDPEFLEDLAHWVGTDRRIALKLIDLMQAVMRDPFSGAGKPEPLRHQLSGTWSRRLTREHRLVYVVSDERVYFIQARFHY